MLRYNQILIDLQNWPNLEFNVELWTAYFNV